MAVIRIMLVSTFLLATEMLRMPPLLANQWNVKSAQLLLNVSSQFSWLVLVPLSELLLWNVKSIQLLLNVSTQFRWLVLCNCQSCYCEM